MVTVTFYHSGNPPSQIPMRGTLIIFGTTIIVTSRDNHRLDILANHRDEGGQLKIDYHRIDLFANERETFEGPDYNDFIQQFSRKIEPDVFKEIAPWIAILE